MANEIVKYDNFMNQLQFRDFEQKDFDLLMALCARMRDLDEETQVFDYEYLMELTGWDKSQRIEIFDENLKRMNEKLIRVNASVDINENESVTFVLFTTFRRNRAKRTLTVSVNKEFKFILNELTSNFTRFELKEYVGLESRYAKQLYQQIRQRYKQRGHFWQPTVEELRRALDIPKNYETWRIYDKILKSAIKTIKSCKGLDDLEVDPVRSKRRGRSIEGYRFTWTAKDQIKGQMSIEELTPDQKVAVTNKKQGSYKPSGEKKRRQTEDEYVEKNRELYKALGYEI